MQPSDELIEKFRRIYFEEYGEEISTQDAYDNFTSLVDLLRIFSRPTKKMQRMHGSGNSTTTLPLV